MRAANSNRNEVQTAIAGEAPVEDQEQEEDEEEEATGQGEVENESAMPVEETVVHHNLVPTVTAATAGDFFQYTSEQQWIT